MVNGLDITEEQFMKMGSRDRDVLVYKNLVHIRQQIKSYKFHKKIQYVWLTVISAVTAALFVFKS